MFVRELVGGEPNDITFICLLLSACSHGGLVLHLVLLLLQWSQIVWFLQKLVHYTCMVKLPEICSQVSGPCNLLSTCSKINLGVSLNFEKAHLKLHTPIKCKKIMKRENEGKRWGALGSSLWKQRKKTHTHTREQSDFLGQNFGQTKRNHSALGKKLICGQLEAHLGSPQR